MIGGYVYIMKSSRVFGSKIGITKKPFTRQSTVDRTTRGDVKIVVCFRFIFYREVETALHGLFAPFRRRIKGSGGTEWFYVPPFITALILTFVWAVSFGGTLMLLYMLYAAVNRSIG